MAIPRIIVRTSRLFGQPGPTTNGPQARPMAPRTLGCGSLHKRALDLRSIPLSRRTTRRRPPSALTQAEMVKADDLEAGG
jgi:hypothetical protein